MVEILGVQAIHHALYTFSLKTQVVFHGFLCAKVVNSDLCYYLIGTKYCALESIMVILKNIKIKKI